jgi:hypothetical protein
MKRAALIVAALATAGAWADTNLVVNGSFELGNFSPWGYDSATELVGTSDISGWTVINNSAAWIGGGNPWGLAAPDGSKFLDLTEFRSSGTLAAVRQTIATVPGTSYLLTFAVGSQTAFGLPVGVTATAGSASNTFSSTAAGNNLWTTFTLPFTASSSSTVLTLAGASGTLYTGLDKVSVVAVPEPSTWMMLLAGCGVVGWASHRNRRPSLTV